MQPIYKGYALIEIIQWTKYAEYNNLIIVQLFAGNRLSAQYYFPIDFNICDRNGCCIHIFREIITSLFGRRTNIPYCSFLRGQVRTHLN